MDKVSLELAMASAKMSGDAQTLQMLMAMSKQASDGAVAAPASQDKQAAPQSAIPAHVGVSSIERVDSEGRHHEVGEDERAKLGRMLQTMLGGMLSGQPGSAEGMPTGVVVMDGEGNVVSGDNIPPEVLAAIEALANGEVPEGAVLVRESGDEDEAEDEGDEDGEGEDDSSGAHGQTVH